MDKSKCENKFNAIILESIDDAFLTLGKNARSSLYFHLETKFAISKQDIPKRVDDFSDALEQIFGFAAKNLEILIMKFLNKKVNCAIDWAGPTWLVPDLTFAKYVKLLEFWFETTKKIDEVEVRIDVGERQEQQTQ
jgi:hypothetical protein